MIQMSRTICIGMLVATLCGTSLTLTTQSVYGCSKTCEYNGMKAACGELLVALHYVDAGNKIKTAAFLKEKETIERFIQDNRGEVLGYDKDLKLLITRFNRDENLAAHKKRLEEFEFVNSVTYNYVSKFE